MNVTTLFAASRCGAHLPCALAFLILFAATLWTPWTATAQTTLTEQQKFLAGDASGGDWFGNAVDIDGTTGIVGAYRVGNDVGSAYIVRFDGQQWVQSAELAPSNLTTNADFGRAVAINGDLAVVGAPGISSVFVFRFDGQQWTEEVRLTAVSGLGADVDVRGDVIVAGTSNQERAYVYRYDGVIWALEATLTGASTSEGFAGSVSLHDDVIAVGAIGFDGAAVNAGGAYVFRYDGTNWTEEAQLTASDAQQDDAFGVSVFIDGDILVAGASQEDGGTGDPLTGAGAVYVFRYDGTSWSQEAKLTAFDARAGDNLGTAVSVSGDGVIAGAPGKFVAGSGNSGAAYVYQFDGAQWTDQGRLFASDAFGGDGFGRAVVIDRNAAFVGAPLEDGAGSASGAVYGFGPTLAVNAPFEASAGAIVDVPVRVGSSVFPIVELLGVGYRMQYDPARITVNVATAGAFIENGDLVNRSFIENPSGYTSIGSFRKGSSTPVAGQGVATDLEVQIPTDAVVGANASLALTDVLGIDADGDRVVIFPEGDGIQVVDPNALSVWPGDTDNSGTLDDAAPAVDVDDILPVANCFDVTGPVRSGAFDITWGPKEAEAFTFPGTPDDDCVASGTFTDPAYADATGDGTIDQNDLSAVGLNFGKARVDGPVTAPTATVLAVAPELLPPSSGPFEALELPPLEKGASYTVQVELTDAVDDLRGVVAALDLPPGLFRVESSDAGAMLDDGDLLALDRYEAETGAFAMAASRKRGAPSTTGRGTLLDLTLVAQQSTTAPVSVELSSLRASTQGGGQVGLPSGAAKLVSPSTGASPPERAFALDPIAPNPVWADATLRYTLDASAPVRLALYDVLGREVRVWVDKRQSAGAHDVAVDASTLSPGVYFVRLSTGSDTATRKLTVIR